MEKSTEVEKKEQTSFFARHSFFVFIVISLCVSFSLVSVSMNLYNKSGAAQLDLSRPGYVSVRSQATNNDSDFQTYSSTGSISKDIINDFQSQYDERAIKVKSVDAFSSDPLSPASLWGITTNS